MGGSPKARLAFGGRSLIRHTAETLAGILSDGLIVTNTPDRYALLGWAMVGDLVACPMFVNLDAPEDLERARVPWARR
jgi:molybdopterin-guanine dinucleotide biosynthesis protein A